MSRVPALARSPVGVRACRALPNGRVLAVNGLGVLEQFEYSWKDWNPPASAAAGEDGDGDTRLERGDGAAGGEEDGEVEAKGQGRAEAKK